MHASIKVRSVFAAGLMIGSLDFAQSQSAKSDEALAHLNRGITL